MLSKISLLNYIVHWNHAFFYKIFFKVLQMLLQNTYKSIIIILYYKNID